MALSRRTECMVLCTCLAYLALVGQSRQLQDEHRDADPSQQPLQPINIDNHATQWSDFGIHDYTFIGTWGPANDTYQAAVWLRLIPAATNNERVVRMVIQLNRAPTMLIDSKQMHAITPKEFLADGKLPTVVFTPVAPPGRAAEPVVVEQHYWEEYITSQWLGGTINGRAVLKADVQYTLSMEGSERLHQIPAFRSSEPNAMFQEGDVWIGMTEGMVANRRAKPYQFLVLEHLRYHLQLGFKGALLVVVPETATLLLAHPGIMEVVQKKQLVLVLWEHGYVSGTRYMLQLPANNLLKTAMAGSNTTLGMWDLDEYLVLPRHRSISYEVNHGCLAQLHDPLEMEAVISFSLTLPPDSSTGPDVAHWRHHGGFEAAVKSMNYTVQPYKHCMHGIYCKALINPNSDYNMHVHQLVRPPPEAGHRNTTDRSCAYAHHFYHLWGRRGWWDQSNISDKVPLALEDMPFNS